LFSFINNNHDFPTAYFLQSPHVKFFLSFLAKKYAIKGKIRKGPGKTGSYSILEQNSAKNHFSGGRL
jgi:hypothetical protein